MDFESNDHSLFLGPVRAGDEMLAYKFFSIEGSFLFPIARTGYPLFCNTLLGIIEAKACRRMPFGAGRIINTATHINAAGKESQQGTEEVRKMDAYRLLPISV